ncbi:2-dehydro-3-deoxygalactonokinase [Pedobacter sp.]
MNLLGNKYVLCCDWGTSSFRIFLVEYNSKKILGSIQNEEGISKVAQRFDAQAGRRDRLMFYCNTLQQHIVELQQKTNVALLGVPLVISGMASSPLGIMELPYTSLPFPLIGCKANVRRIDKDQNFMHDIYLISGVKSPNDVMRGEEVQLIGLAELMANQNLSSAIVILPGTHSKHVKIIDGVMVDFSTYITGEVFATLVNHSLLKEAVSSPNEITQGDWGVFEDGVNASVDTNILQELFTVRTNILFKFLSKEQNYIYLSGLLIGAELRELINSGKENIVLCCGKKLFDFYQFAINMLYKGETSVTYIPPSKMDEITINGQIAVYQSYKQYAN